MAKWYYTPPKDSKYIELSSKEYQQLHGGTKRTQFQKKWAYSLQPFVDTYKDFKNTAVIKKSDILDDGVGCKIL